MTGSLGHTAKSGTCALGLFPSHTKRVTFTSTIRYAGVLVRLRHAAATAVAAPAAAADTRLMVMAAQVKKAAADKRSDWYAANIVSTLGEGLVSVDSRPVVRGYPAGMVCQWQFSRPSSDLELSFVVWEPDGAAVRSPPPPVPPRAHANNQVCDGAGQCEHVRWDNPSSGPTGSDRGGRRRAADTRHLQRH